MPNTPETDPTLFDYPVTADEETEDLAAETDDAVPADAADIEDYPPTEPAFTGVCRGGPYDGRIIPNRFSGGFLLFDKARARMWRYIASVQRPGEYVCLGHPVAITAVDILERAAEGSELDVLAYDEGPAVA